MRTLTGGETTTLGGANYQISLRVKVANGSGTLKDMSALSSIDWQQSVSIDNQIDQPVSQCTLTFSRSKGSTLSLAPLRTDSTLNRLDDGTTYSPLLDAGRLVTVETATTPIGTSPVAGDWKLLFKGYIDSVSAEKDPVSVVCRDEGGVLVDRWIEVENTINAGTPLETAMQMILDACLGTGVVMLYVPVSPSFVISDTSATAKGYTQKQESLMDAMTTLAALPGWTVGYLWDNTTSQFRFTLYQPPRTKTTPDYTFGPSVYLDVNKLQLDRVNIRNAILINYAGTQTYAASDSVSIAKYGRRWMQITEASDSQISSSSEATAFGNAILSDLKDPIAEFEIETMFFWPAALGDLYRFSANSVHFNGTQDWAVVSVKHDLSTNQHRTTILVRGKPAGSYLYWLSRDVPGSGPDENEIGLRNLVISDETLTTRTYSWIPGALVSEVWWNAVEVDVPNPSDPWDLVRADPKPLALGINTLTVLKPGPGKETLIQLEPRLADYSPGIVRRLDIKAAPTQPPVVAFATSETGTLGTLYMSVQERGAAVQSVMVAAKVGNASLTAFTPFIRQAGATSTIKGRALVAGEYEHDIGLDMTRLSWMTPRIVMADGSILNYDTPPFDRNQVPDIVNFYSVGTMVVGTGDSDGKSWKLVNIGGTWEFSADGSGINVDVLKQIGNGASGSQAVMGSADTWNIGAYFYAETRAARTGSTVYDYRTLSVSGPSASAQPYWETVTATAPVAGSASRTVTLTLDADATASGNMAKVYARQNVEGVWSAFVDVSSTISSAITTAPTSATSYTYALSDSTYNMSDPSSGLQLVNAKTIEVELRADLYHAGVVVSTRTTSATWRYGGGSEPVQSTPPGMPQTPDTPKPLWTSASISTPSTGSKTLVVTLQSDHANGLVTLKRRFDDGQGFTGWADITSSVTPALSASPTSSTAYTYTGLSSFYARATSGNLVTFTVEIAAEITKDGVLTDTRTVTTSWKFNETRY